MTFVMDRAWEEALRLLKGNLGLLLTVAGVVVFLPTVASTLIFPQSDFESRMPQGDDPSMQQMSEAMAAILADYWWLFAITILISIFANLALMALLRRQRTPTVAEAFSEAMRAMPTAIGAVALQIAIFAALVVVLVGLPSAASSALGAVGALLLLPIALYLVVKFSVTSAVIIIEGERNPVAVLRRSWWLTKGNSFRLFFFYLLLLVAFIVVSAIASLVVGAVFALATPSVATFGLAIYEAALSVIVSLVAAAITVAIHAQLRRLREQGPAAD